MTETLHWIDYLIIISTVSLTIVIGIYFVNKQKSSDNYFAGSGNIPSWAIGMSIFATLISSITFLAYPSAAFASNWILLVQGLMVPLVLIGMIWFIIPLYRKVIRLSAYEYFEKRFGFFARLYSSLAFMLMTFAGMGTVLYLLGLALSSMMGANIFLIIGVLGFLVMLLTLIGGMEAVIWMDVVQGSLLIGGGLLCVGVLLFGPEEGISNVFHEITVSDKVGFGPYSWDFTQLTFFVMAFNGVLYAVQKYGTDQTMVQRYLTAKNDKEAKSAAFMGILLSIPVWALFMFIGTALFVFYQISAAKLPAEISADAVFPYFIMTELPIGVTGFVIAGLIAAAISSLDSDTNCLAAIGVEDYYQRFKPDCTDQQRLKAGRVLVAIIGIAAMGVAVLYVIWEGEGVLGIIFGLYAIFSAGIAGIFLLGLLSRRANKQGLYVGISVCILFTAYAVLTSTKIGEGPGLLLDLGPYNFPHHKYMIGVYSHLIVFGVGYIASFFFKAEKAPLNLTIYGYFQNRTMRDQEIENDQTSNRKTKVTAQ